MKASMAFLLVTVLLMGCQSRHESLRPIADRSHDKPTSGQESQEVESEVEVRKPDEPEPIPAATFSYLNENIFKPRCQVCHAPGGSQEWTSLVTYEDFLAEDNDLVYLDEPEDSPLLYRMTQSDPRKVMPPPNSGLPVANEQEIALILKWIQDGAPR